MFRPKSIAVIGASKTPGKIGYEIMDNIITYGFKGEVYPINLKETESPLDEPGCTFSILFGYF